MSSAKTFFIMGSACGVTGLVCSIDSFCFSGFVFFAVAVVCGILDAAGFPT